MDILMLINFITLFLQYLGQILGCKMKQVKETMTILKSLDNNNRR